MFLDGTTDRDGGLVCTSRRGGKTVRLHIRDRYVQRHSDLLAILSLTAVMFLVGFGIFSLGESIHVPAQARIFAGPVSTI
jgi:hypothetical protein